ncbi:hypothetical protein [Sphingomicrobium clamense]|uniref:Uncharacterized protein n=1 Tax=Sphingomicrobium clamense TaxID=2851013 RepID=A0ABS6V6Y9_9SPHN|nr:hypothetical protein [Sphingomicrobium sp. B8]MBW0145130.1 hypothetical protein [Sphingomicrobium sp. B8]
MADDKLNRRTETAKRNDNAGMIETLVETPSQQGRNGGVLNKDVATQAAEERIDDPDATEGVTKEDQIAHGMFEFSDKRGDV